MDQQTKTALKQQDAYISATEHGIEWAQKNRRSVIVSGAVVLALILLAVIAGVVYNSRSEKASVAFGAAMQAYQTPLAAPGQQVPPGIKTFATPNERAKAANNLFMGVANQYGMTPDGKTARYFAGLTYMEAGQNAEAESTLKQVAGGWNHDLAALAKLSLAQLYRQTNRSAEAVALYNELSGKSATTVPAGLAQLQLAELYESEGKPDAAKKIYAQLKDKDAKGAAGVLAAQKLNPTAAPAGISPIAQ